MKTIEELIFDKKFKGEEFNPNDFNDWAKENESEAYKLCLQVAKQLQQHLVGGPGSDVRSEGEQLPAEGQGEANTCAGCEHTHVLWINSDWKYFCLDCGAVNICV